MMRRLVTMVLGILVAGMFALAAFAVIRGTMSNPDYKHEGFRVDLFELTAGGVVAFLVATLGIAVANSESETAASLRAAVSGDPAKKGGDWLIGVVGAIYITVGIAFVVIAVFPEMVATKEGAPPITDAPAHITSQAKAFVGVALAGLASIATALKASS